MNWVILGQIFLINLVYIVFNTIRTLLTMRGYRYIAPFVAIVEMLVYTIGLSLVMQYINENIFYLLAYALGFGLGIYLGIVIEDRIALGYTSLQIFVPNDNHYLADALREQGYGVTVQSGYGRTGERLVLTVLTPRSAEVSLRHTINELDPDAFYISYTANYIQGGFWAKRVDQPKIVEEAAQTIEKTAEEADPLSKQDFLN